MSSYWMDQLQQIKALGNNYNGYDSSPPSKKSIEVAYELCNKIDNERLRADVNISLQVFPESDGGIEISIGIRENLDKE